MELNDLISRSALYQKVFFHTYPTKILDNERKVLNEVLRLIDNAPTVEEEERPQGEWSLVEHKKNIDLVCPRCGYHRCNLAYGFSIEEVREQIKEEISNDNSIPNYLIPDFCERCGAKLGFGGNKE